MGAQALDVFGVTVFVGHDQVGGQGVQGLQRAIAGDEVETLHPRLPHASAAAGRDKSGKIAPRLHAGGVIPGDAVAARIGIFALCAGKTGIAAWAGAIANAGDRTIQKDAGQGRSTAGGGSTGGSCAGCCRGGAWCA